MTMGNDGKLLVECLQAPEARYKFGVPGESYLAVPDALYDTRGAPDFTLYRKERDTAFMTAACGKLTGQTGICFITRSPGAANTSIRAHTAMHDSVPLFLFAGQVATDVKGREVFQEIDYRVYFDKVPKGRPGSTMWTASPKSSPEPGPLPFRAGPVP